MIDVLFDNAELLLQLVRLLCTASEYVPRMIRMAAGKKARSWKNRCNFKIGHTVPDNIALMAIWFGFRIAPALRGSRGDYMKIVKTLKKPATVHKKNTIVHTRTCGKSEMPKQQFSIKSGKTVKNLARYATRKIYVLDLNGNWFKTQMNTAVMLILEGRMPNQPLPISRNIYGLITAQECKRCHQRFFYVHVSRPHTVCGSCLRRRQGAGTKKNPRPGQAALARRR